MGHLLGFYKRLKDAFIEQGIVVSSPAYLF